MALQEKINLLKFPQKPVNLEQGSSSGLKIGSFENPADVKQATLLIKNGLPIAGHFRGVYGLWTDVNNKEAIKKTYSIKGESNLDKPFSAMLQTEDFLKLIDFSALPVTSQKILENIQDFRDRVGAICHVRAPISEDAVEKYHVPQSLLSNSNGKLYMQNLDPAGHEPINEFIGDLKEAGVPFVGVTSLNEHSKGEAEITTMQRAKEFCAEKRVNLLLRDPFDFRPEIVGSFAIVDIENLSVIRNGHVPAETLKKVFGINLNTNNMKDSKYSPAYYPTLNGIMLTPREERVVVLMHINKKSEEEIKQVILIGREVINIK